MKDKLLIGVVVTVLFMIYHFIDVRLIQKDNKTPIKYMIKDTVGVFISTCLGLYLIEHFDLLSNPITKPATAAFVDEPKF